VSGAPKTVAVLSLCADIVAADIVERILAHEELEVLLQSGLPANPLKLCTTKAKQQLQFFPVGRHLNDVLDAAKAADYIAIVMSATVEVDALGELFMACIQAQGAPTLLPCASGLDALPMKRRNGVKRSLLSFTNYYFPAETKVSPFFKDKIVFFFFCFNVNKLTSCTHSTRPSTSLCSLARSR